MAKFTISTVFNAVDKLTPEMKKMQTSAKGLKKSMSAAFSGLASEVKFFAGAAGVAAGGITAVTAAASKFAATGDEIAKTSRMLGMSTDALQELRYAANMSGVSAESLDGAFKKLNKNMGDLKTGTGAFYTTLQKTNPELADQLKTAKDTDDAFMLMMDAISKETDATKRAQLAQAAFGVSGQELIKVAAGGTDSIKALREEAHKYGNVISEEAATKSEEFGDSMTRLKGAASSVATVGLSVLVAKLQPVIQSMAEWIAENKDFIAQNIQGVIDGIGVAVKIVSAAWNSGLIPAVIAGVTAFNVVTGAINAFKAAQEIATIAQMAMNAAMNANPIGLVIMGVTALTAGIVLLIKNFDKIKSFFQWIFDKLKSGVFDKIAGLFGIGKGKTETTELTSTASASSHIPMSAQAAMAQASYSESKSTVDVNFNNAPSGTVITQNAAAPGVSVNMGYSR